MAQAAPATPIFKTMIVNKSSTIFITDEINRKIRGVVLSPMDRMIPARILYRQVAGIPKKITNIYA